MTWAELGLTPPLLGKHVGQRSNHARQPILTLGMSSQTGGSWCRRECGDPFKLLQTPKFGGMAAGGSEELDELVHEWPERFADSPASCGA